MTIKEMIFKSQGQSISGILSMPDSEKPPVVIGLHGLFGSKESNKLTTMAEKCAEAKIAFIRLGWEGSDNLDKIIKQGSYKIYLQRVKDCIKTVKESGNFSDSIGLFGSSYGAALSIAAAAFYKDIKALVLVSPPVSPKYIINNPIPEKLSADITDQCSEIKNVLLFHSKQDELVKFESSKKVFESAGDPKKLIQYSGSHKIEFKEFENKVLMPAFEWFRESLS